MKKLITILGLCALSFAFTPEKTYSLRLTEPEAVYMIRLLEEGRWDNVGDREFTERKQFIRMLQTQFQAQIDTSKKK